MSAISTDETAARQLTVNLVRGNRTFLQYRGSALYDDGVHLVVRATWAEASERDVGYVRFEFGDVWTEHYWRDRWYAVKEIRAASGQLKGWYCDVTRPAVVRGNQVISVDLFLDLWVSGDLTTVLRLDEDEFLASGLVATDPEAAVQAQQALDELELLAATGFADIAVAVTPPS